MSVAMPLRMYMRGNAAENITYARQCRSMDVFALAQKEQRILHTMKKKTKTQIHKN
jgi:hypothetical protein